MDWGNLGKTIVKAGAPLLGTVIGGPAGTAVGALVGSLFGADPNDPEAMAEAIAKDPEAAAKLRKLELEHQAELARLNLQEAQSYLADRQDARAREVAITKATGKRDVALYVLAGLVVTGFFALCVILFIFPIPKDQGNVVMVLFGGLVTGFGTVLNYFFGSSKGSSDKTALLASGATKQNAGG